MRASFAVSAVGACASFGAHHLHWRPGVADGAGRRPLVEPWVVVGGAVAGDGDASFGCAARTHRQN